MKVNEELVKKIKAAIESIEYGSVEITLNEKGPFIEITTHERERLEKSEYHLG